MDSGEVDEAVKAESKIDHNRNSDRCYQKLLWSTACSLVNAWLHDVIYLSLGIYIYIYIYIYREREREREERERERERESERYRKFLTPVVSCLETTSRRHPSVDTQASTSKRRHPSVDTQASTPKHRHPSVDTQASTPKRRHQLRIKFHLNLNNGPSLISLIVSFRANTRRTAIA